MSKKRLVKTELTFAEAERMIREAITAYNFGIGMPDLAASSDAQEGEDWIELPDDETKGGIEQDSRNSSQRITRDQGKDHQKPIGFEQQLTSQPDLKNWYSSLRCFGWEGFSPNLELLRSLRLPCDIISQSFADNLASIFCRQIIFLPATAASVFDEFFKPLQSIGYLLQTELSAKDLLESLIFDEAELIDNKSVLASKTVQVFRPSVELFCLALWQNCKLNFLLARSFNLLISNINAGIKSELNTTIWGCMAKLLAYVRRPLDFANCNETALLKLWSSTTDDFDSRPMYLDECRKLQELLCARLDRDSYRKNFSVEVKRFFSGCGYIKSCEILQTLAPALCRDSAITLLPSGSGYDSNHRLILAPQLESRLWQTFNFEHAIKAPHDKIYPPEGVVSGLLDQSSNQRLLHSCYGVIIRREVEITNANTIAAKITKKLAKAQLPDWHPVEAQLCIDRTFGIICKLSNKFNMQEGYCEPKACSFGYLLRRLFVPDSTWDLFPFLWAALHLPRDRWITTSELSKHAHSSSYFSDFDNNELVFRGLLLGIVDVNYDLKAGQKQGVSALRLNWSAVEELFFPNLRNTSSPNSNEKNPPKLSRPDLSCKVDILPNFEIITAPNVHPAIAVSLNTIFNCTRDNCYVIDESLRKNSARLDLNATEVTEYLRSISRHELPLGVKKRIEELCGHILASKVFMPEFIVSGVSKEQLDLALSKRELDNLFAFEIAPNTWGLFESRYFGTLRDYEVDLSRIKHVGMRRLVKELHANKFSVSGDFREMRSSGCLPKSGTEMPKVDANRVVRGSFFEADGSFVSDRPMHAFASLEGIDILALSTKS